jgi:hypothetical protein
MKRILTANLIFFTLSCSGICIADEKQGAQNEPSKSKSRSGAAEKTLKKIGPFEIDDQNFTVVLDITKQRGYAAEYNGFDIKDENGLSHYKQALESRDVEGVFKLEGKSGEGLIFYYNEERHAPHGEKSFQIFGVEKGKVKPLSEPVKVHGQMQILPKGNTAGSFKLFDGDVLTLEIWKDFFGVIIPLEVDFKKLTVKPLKQEADFDIIASPGQPHTSFQKPVKLYKDHDMSAKVEKIAAAGLAKIRFLNAFGKVQLERRGGGQMLDIDVSNVWLKVAINEKEGWVNDLEDFFRLGLKSNKSVFVSTGVVDGI